MNLKNKSKQIKKSNKQKVNKTNTNPEDNIISRLMNEYNISEENARKIIRNIERKNTKTNENPSNQIIQKKNLTDIPPKDLNKNFNNSQNHMKKSTKIHPNQDKFEKVNDLNNMQTNVDTIISDIIPDYKQKSSIELDNVNLSFDIITDKIDTLKEKFIRTLKRKNTKKIKFQALKNISFKIYQGEKVGIIGYNGAGKSTLLNVITGIYTPDSGNVITHGKISPLLSLGAGFDFNYSGRKNIYLNGAVLGYDKQFLKEKEQEIIEFSELGDFIDIPIKNYSSGMLAKLGFSIATVVNPDILIIDEILGVGDVNFQKKSNDKIRSLMDGNTTVLLVSHSIQQIRYLCNKAIWIDNGQIKKIGDVNEICDAYIKDSEKASREQVANIRFK